MAESTASLRRRYLWHVKRGRKAYRLRRAYQRAKVKKARAKRAARLQFQPWMLNGRPGNISASCKRFIVRAVKADLVVTSTTGGKHASTSWHYKRKAVDVAGPWDKMVAFQKLEARDPARFLELFGPDNRANVKNGRALTLSEGSALENQHDNHIHGALK